MYFKSLKPL
jgi:hypothetical protein